jgi:hypothetical protein
LRGQKAATKVEKVHAVAAEAKATLVRVLWWVLQLDIVVPVAFPLLQGLTNALLLLLCSGILVVRTEAASRRPAAAVIGAAIAATATVVLEPVILGERSAWRAAVELGRVNVSRALLEVGREVMAWEHATVGHTLSEISTILLILAFGLAISMAVGMYEFVS